MLVGCIQRVKGISDVLDWTVERYPLAQSNKVHQLLCLSLRVQLVLLGVLHFFGGPKFGKNGGDLLTEVVEVLVEFEENLVAKLRLLLSW